MNYLKNENGLTLVELIVGLGFLAFVGFGIFLLTVAWHFISKFW